MSVHPKRLADEDQQFARARLMTALLSGFAGMATLLALLGICGVTAYAVQQREIAIRTAVGATNRAVTRLFLRDGGVVIGAGIGAGLFAAAGVGRLLESQIHGVHPFDFATLLAACAFLVACGLRATWWPVRRAAGGDVVTMLKAE